jgi:hypothetical protein
MPLVGFEPAIPASAPPQAHALDRAATGIGQKIILPKEHVLRFLHLLICDPKRKSQLQCRNIF